MDIHVKIHVEEGSFWAEVEELPGCFATGDTLNELTDSLNEALDLYLSEPAPQRVPVSAFSFTQTISTQRAYA